MARPSQRCIFLLCVCLLLQQFTSAYTAHIHHHASKHSKENTKDKEVQRKTIISGDKFIGSKLLREMIFTSYGNTFGGTVLQAIARCKEAQPSIEDDFKAFQEVYNKFDAVKKKMRDTSKQATERQIHANESFYQNKATRMIIKEIADEQALVLKYMGTQALQVINNVSHQIESFFKQANQTGQEVDVIQIKTTFEEGIELGLQPMIASANLAMPGLELLLKQYLKDTLVCQKISSYIDKSKAKIIQPSTVEAKRQLSLILAKGFLGKSTTYINSKINSFIGSRVAPKFSKAKKLFDSTRSGIKGLLKLGTKAWALWASVETFKNCKQKAEDTKKSVKDMRKHLNKIKKYLKEIEKGNDIVNQVWVDVWKVTTADNVLEVLTDLKAMMLDEAFSMKEDEKQDFAQKIQAFIESKDLNPDQEGTKQELISRQTAMNEVLKSITVTLSCIKLKGQAFELVSEDCSRGRLPFSYIYDDIVRKLPFDPDKNCKERTGMDYVTKETMREAWKARANANGTINETCLMNSKFIMVNIRDKVQDKITDPQLIAQDLFDQDVIPYSLDEIGSIVNRIKVENPNIMNQKIPSNLKGFVCAMKKQNPDNPQLIIDAMAYTVIDLTLEDVENLDCDE